MTCPESQPAVVVLNRGWCVLPLGEMPEAAWITASESEVSVGVMRVRWEHSGDGQAVGWHSRSLDDRSWRLIRVQDPRAPEAGADRYRTRWQARYITALPEPAATRPTGGSGLTVRKSIDLLNQGRYIGWMAVICRTPFELAVNGQAYPGRGSHLPQLFTLRLLRPGLNTFEIRTARGSAILAEGQIFLPGGAILDFFTCDQWESRLDDGEWRPAREWLGPPEPPWGEPPYPHMRPEPSVLWYRQQLPPGSVGITMGRIEGTWRAWYNDQPLSFTDGRAVLPDPAPARNLLAIQVTCRGTERGLITPLRVRCLPATVDRPGEPPWPLDWYDGPVLFRHPDTGFLASLRSDDAWELDLGRTCGGAGVWLGQREVGLWPGPGSRLAGSGGMHAGEPLTIVVQRGLVRPMPWDLPPPADPEDGSAPPADLPAARDCAGPGRFGPVVWRSASTPAGGNDRPGGASPPTP